MDTLLEVLKEAKAKHDSVLDNHFPFDVNVYLPNLGGATYTRVTIDEGLPRPETSFSIDDTLMLIDFSCHPMRVHHDYNLDAPPYANSKNYVRLYYDGVVQIAVFGVDAIMNGATMGRKLHPNMTNTYFLKLPLDISRVSFVDNK